MDAGSLRPAATRDAFLRQSGSHSSMLSHVLSLPKPALSRVEGDRPQAVSKRAG